MSDTAAVAAVTASETLSCGSFSDSGVLSRGSSTSTSPSQKHMRSRKNILRFPNHHVEVDCAGARNLSRPDILDKSQVIEADLIRRNFAKNPIHSIRR